MKPARFRGPLISSEYNDFNEGVVADITNLSNSVNLLYNSLQSALTTQDNENAYLRRQIRSLLNQQDYVERISITNNLITARYIDLGSAKNLTFPNGLNDEHSSMLNAKFGEITLPVTAIENKFYVNSLVNGTVVLPPDLTVSVRGTFDKSTGDGPVNYERGGKVTIGQAKNAFSFFR